LVANDPIKHTHTQNPVAATHSPITHGKESAFDREELIAKLGEVNDYHSGIAVTDTQAQPTPSAHS